MEKPNVTYSASSFKMIKGEKSYNENIKYATLDELLEFIDKAKEYEDDGIVIHTYVNGTEIKSSNYLTR